LVGTWRRLRKEHGTSVDNVEREPTLSTNAAEIGSRRPGYVVGDGVGDVAGDVAGEGDGAAGTRTGAGAPTGGGVPTGTGV
jgi:hypothetical protein